MGEDIDVLYDYIHSNPDFRDYCDCNVRDGEMAEGYDRVKGDYNEFWAGRDYLNDMGTLKAAVLMSQGFNDWNVVPEHSNRISQALKAKGVPVQIYYHQGGHGGSPPFKMMNRWFTRYLYDVKTALKMIQKPGSYTRKIKTQIPPHIKIIQTLMHLRSIL